MSKLHENNAGGRRPGAGRKPNAEKKVPVTIYVKPSVIAYMEGRKSFMSFLYDEVEAIEISFRASIGTGGFCGRCEYGMIWNDGRTAAVRCECVK